MVIGIGIGISIGIVVSIGIVIVVGIVICVNIGIGIRIVTFWLVHPNKGAFQYYVIKLVSFKTINNFYTYKKTLYKRTLVSKSTFLQKQNSLFKTLIT